MVNEAQGFGFITPEGDGGDLFAHFREVQGSGFKALKEGHRAEFEVRCGTRSLQVAAIKPL